MKEDLGILEFGRLGVSWICCSSSIWDWESIYSVLCLQFQHFAAEYSAGFEVKGFGAERAYKVEGFGFPAELKG